MRRDANHLAALLDFALSRYIAKGKRMGIDRLTEKLERASGVVGRQTTKIEARADAIIAREDAIEKRTEQVFTPHEAMLSAAEKGLDGLDAKLRLLSNDPLEGSTGSPQAAPEVPAVKQTFPAAAE